MSLRAFLHGFGGVMTKLALGVANGIATLDASGKVPASQLPSYVDDVLEYTSLAAFPASGTSGIIYVAQDTNKIYRWSGSAYIEISATAGNSDTATKLATPRTIGITGDGTWSVTFDGSTNVSAALTLANSGATAGSYGSTTQIPVVTVDAKGRITGVSVVTAAPTWGNIASKPTTIGGFGITDTGIVNYAVNMNQNVRSIDAPTFGGMYLTGDLYGTAFRAAQGVPNSADNSSNGYAFGPDGDSGLFSPIIGGGGAANGAVSVFCNNTEITRFTSTGVQFNVAMMGALTGNASTATKFQTARLINGVSFDGSADITISDSTRIASTEKGAANGVATLDSGGKVPAAQLPSYVDDVLEYANLAGFPGVGETGKIYVAQDTNKIYRWSGSLYIEVSPTAGNADSATKLATARSINMTGDGTWSVIFDGSGNVTNNFTLNNTSVIPGAYSYNDTLLNLTVDAKGRITNINPVTIRTASTVQNGLVQLNDSLTSTSVSQALTANQGKVLKDLVDTKQAALGFTPVQQGGGTGQNTNKVYIGWASSTLNLQVDSTNFGATWPISISGNASAATQLATARNINGVAFNGTGDITVYDGTKLPLSGGTMQGVLWGQPLNALMASNDSSGSIVVQNAGGSGDTGMAMLPFLCQGVYGIKMGLRADGYFGIGGWSRANWSWYTDPSGNMVAAGNVTAMSDPRLKENIRYITGAIDLFKQLNGVYFNWKTGIPHIEVKAGKEDLGVLADEVERIFPQIVTESIEIDGVRYKTVAYEKLIPVAIQAVKELDADNTTLRMQVQAQEKTLSELMKLVKSLQTDVAALKAQS